MDFGKITPKTLRMFERIAQWGYLVIASQYSGCGGSEGKDEFGGQDLLDVLNLRRVLKRHPRADVRRIGMIGWSRGGLMTYLALAKVRWIRAAVSVAGVADVAALESDRPEMARRLRRMFRHTPRSVAQRSAIRQVRSFSRTAPLLLIHGTADWRVSPLQSMRLGEQLYRHRIPFRLVVLEGADHGLSGFRKEENRLTKEWLDRYVKGQRTLPNLRPHGP
ncbi:MAG: peptidase [Parcubacteria group bacterium Gr01-1014_38]|nr:MAG: peptidase [Parcubacteria group bacterium Gr01-1014_38]